MTKAFGYRELVNCLTSLGFSPKSQNSSHIKYYHKNKNCVGKYPFIEVQVGRGSYGTNSAKRYIQQLKRFGFTKKEIEDCL